MKNDFRYEIKFVLNEREMSHALTWLSIIGTKKFSDRSINSLYFDNLKYQFPNPLIRLPLPDFRVFETKMSLLA